MSLTDCLLNEMRADAGKEMIGGYHPSGVRLFQGGLDAQVTCALRGLLDDPLQNPLVALVAQRHFQRHGVVAAEPHETDGRAVAQHNGAQAYAGQPEAGAENRIVAQRVQEVGRRHCPSETDCCCYYIARGVNC